MSNKIRQYWWPVNAIALGVWESAAFASGKRIPTITCTAQTLHSKKPRLAKVLITLWTVGLYRHLVQAENR